MLFYATLAWILPFVPNLIREIFKSSLITIKHICVYSTINQEIYTHSIYEISGSVFQLAITVFIGSHLSNFYNIIIFMLSMFEKIYHVNQDKIINTHYYGTDLVQNGISV